MSFPTDKGYFDFNSFNLFIDRIDLWVSVILDIHNNNNYDIYLA